VLARQYLDLLFIEDDPIDQGISRFECPVGLTVLDQELIQKPLFLFPGFRTVQNADRPKHNHARVHQSRVTGVRFTAMQVPDFRDLNAYPGIALYISEEVSLMITSMEVQQVAAFVDVDT
jgi:hypothetical protein